MKQKRDQRTILIVSLLVIVFIMVVGFATFATNLTINGTANISTNWCVGFDNTKTTAYEITKGKSTGTNPSATMEYEGTACSSTYVPIANLGAVFYQPGDKVEYTLTIANKGSVDAAIESIKVNGSSVTSNQTITDGNIIWKVYMPESTTLSATTGTTTMKVSAEFQNTTDISNLTTGGSSSLTVGINVVQGTSGMAITPAGFTGTIYRNETNYVRIGESILPETVEYWEYEDYDEDWGAYYTGYYTTEQECLAQNSKCRLAYMNKPGVSSYVTDPKELNKSYYLKHDVVNDIITTNYVCFIINNNEYCIKVNNDNSDTFNIPILDELNNSGLISCEYATAGYYGYKCSNNNLGRITASGGETYNNLHSFVGVGISHDVFCGADTSGGSTCFEG